MNLKPRAFWPEPPIFEEDFLHAEERENLDKRYKSVILSYTLSEMTKICNGNLWWAPYT